MRVGVRLAVWVVAAGLLSLVAGCAVQPSGTGNPTPHSPTPTQPVAGEWTWVSGASTAGQAGVYGTLGVAAAANVPGARSGAVGWTDASGALWLFGGQGPSVGSGCEQYSALCWSGTNTWFNDLWRYTNGQWVWMAGSNTPDQPGVYGTLGVVAASNAPGARYGALSWTDAQGNFWLFGGVGYDVNGNIGPLNDLWRYGSGGWTWMGGAKTINQPGTYGTLGLAAASNAPGARADAVGVTDAQGNFWLFGGQGCDSTSGCGDVLNDLWRYSNGEWTWMSGTTVAFPAQPGVYGSEGVAAAGNTPGGRYGAFGWMDASGNLWIFGGVGYGTWDDNVGGLDDLWRYGNGEWTWVGGNNSSPNVLGTYGAEGVAAAGNFPGTRSAGANWTDAQGNLWLFGGEGFGSSFSGGGYFNDLWRYSGGDWTWMDGSGVMETGVYGTMGVPAAANTPGARLDAVSWTDAQGHLWLFGGEMTDSDGQGGELNDLWEYQP